MKKTVSLFLALVLLLCLTPSALAVVEPSREFYVADYAHVLDSSTRDTILRTNAALEQRCEGAQIVVVTVDYLDGKYCDDYAWELFNNWGVGSAQYNNGMLLLLSTGEKKAYVVYGLGLQTPLSSRTVNGWMEDCFWGDFDRGNYDRAVSRLFAEMTGWYEDYYGVSLSDDALRSAGGGTGGFLNLLIRIAVVLLLIRLFTGGGRGGGGFWRFLMFNSLLNNVNRGGYRGGFGGSSRGGFGGGMGRGGGGIGGGGAGRR